MQHQRTRRAFSHKPRRNPVKRIAATLGALLMLLLTGFLPQGAQAAIQEIHVMAVGIDSSPEAATKKALDYARKRAIYLVLRKLHVEKPEAVAATLTEAQLDRIIRGATINDTKRADYNTYANVTVSILDTVLLQELGLETPAELLTVEPGIPARGVLVLPVFALKDRPYVWEKENPMRGPLSNEVLRIAHGAVVVPTGDFEDLRLIDYRNVLTVKSDELKPMFDRYGVEEIIIAIVSRKSATSDLDSTILLRRLSLKEMRAEQIELPPAALQEPFETRLQEAVATLAATAADIASSTSKQQREKLDAAPKIILYFRYGNVREIGQLQKEIRGTEGVMFLAVPSISLQDMHGTLYLSGDKEAVRKALTKQAIIVRDYRDGWQVSLR